MQKAAGSSPATRSKTLGDRRSFPMKNEWDFANGVVISTESYEQFVALYKAADSLVLGRYEDNSAEMNMLRTHVGLLRQIRRRDLHGDDEV